MHPVLVYYWRASQGTRLHQRNDAATLGSAFDPHTGMDGDEHRFSGSKGVSALLHGVTNALFGLLEMPLVAAPLGVALGVAHVVVSRYAAALVTPVDPALGFMKAILLQFLGMGFLVAAFLAYFAWARGGFLVFALSTVVAFIGSLGYVAFRTASPLSVKSSG